MAKFDTRLIPNYVAALAIIGVFLWSFGYVIINFDDFSDLVIVEGDETQTAIRSGVAASIVTAQIFILKEVTSYLFRKNPSNNEPSTTE